MSVGASSGATIDDLMIVEDCGGRSSESEEINVANGASTIRRHSEASSNITNSASLLEAWAKRGAKENRNFAKKKHAKHNQFC